MALHTALPVYRDTYKLVLEIFVSTKNFPKEYKYSLGRDMERDVLVLILMIQILNVTRQELLEIIKEGVKLELNRQRSIGNPLNRLSITGEDTEYLTRNEVSKVLNVTVQTLNNWRREGVLNPIKIGGRVLYRLIANKANALALALF